MNQTRQLAAIMFTDIVGYTELMGNDEQKAFTILTKNRALQKPIIDQFKGRWIKELGDGVMASFNTVSDAVNAAINIQETCNTLHDFQLRIGIHLGELVFENEDVFGDGVNIASRIQAIAIPGGIYISESIYNIISNKPEIKTRFVRTESLKNVKEIVRIYEVITASTTEDEHSKRKEQALKIPAKSIAVLPFENMSNDPDQEYFSDGIAEEIINSLAHIKDLKIAGRTSSAQFKGKQIDLRDIGKLLGVETVMEGSIRKQGNRIRITAQLINVTDGFHLWSEKYDRNMDDIFAIQDEIALAITEQLKITLLEKDREIIIKPTTQNTEAFDLYLKGRFYLGRRGSSILTALQLFKQAIALDGEYALAYAGKCDALLIGAAYCFFSGKKIREEAKNAAETAIKIDNMLGEGYFSLGYYYVTVERNWELSKMNYLKAMELNPGFVQARSLYAMIYLGWAKGKFDEAELQGRIATRLEPLSAIDHADLSWTLLMAGKGKEALATARAGIELDNNSYLSHQIAGLSYIVLQRYNEAISTFLHLISFSNRHQHAINGLIWAYCSKGDMEEATRLKEELELRSATEYIGYTYSGISAAYLGELDKAIVSLEKAYIELDPLLLTIKYAPYLPAALRKDPRFQSLLDKMGYPT